MNGRPVLFKDPVCGMQLEEDDVQETVNHGGVIYRFCSTACRQKFEQAPER